MTKKLPVSVNKEDFMKLLEGAKKQREKFRKKRSGLLTPRGININQYMIAMILGFGAGMRISEIVGFEEKDYDYIPKLKDENQNKGRTY